MQCLKLGSGQGQTPSWSLQEGYELQQTLVYSPVSSDQRYEPASGRLEEQFPCPLLQMLQMSLPTRLSDQAAVAP